MLYLIQFFQNDKYCRSGSRIPLAASGVVGQDDQVGQNNTGLVVSDEEECVGAKLCIASSGQCCFVKTDGREGFRCPDSC